MGPARGGSERGSPRALPAHSARSAPAGTGAAASPVAAARRRSPKSGPAAARGGARAVPRAGRRRPDSPETPLSALRRPRLPRPRARAAAGRAAEPVDFSPVRGAPHRAQGTRAAVGHAAAPGPPPGDGVRAARSLRAAARCWRGGGHRVWRPRAADGSPPPAPPPGHQLLLHCSRPDWRRRAPSATGSRAPAAGALAAPPGPERSPGAAGRSQGRGLPPARTSHGGLSRGGTAAPGEVRAAAPPDPGRARRPGRPPGAGASRLRALPAAEQSDPAPPSARYPPLSTPGSLPSARRPPFVSPPFPPLASPSAPPPRARPAAQLFRQLALGSWRGGGGGSAVSPGRDRARGRGGGGPGFPGPGEAGGGGQRGGVCVCCIPHHLLLVHPRGVSPIQQVALGGRQRKRKNPGSS